MKRWRPALLASAAILFLAIALILAKAGADRRDDLRSTHARLVELRAQRVAPHDSQEMKRALAAGPDPQSGLLIASEAEAASRLEAIIRSIAENHQAEVQSISFTTNSTGDAPPTVRGRLHITVADKNIGVFVKALETGPPAIFLDSLRIALRPSSDRDTEPLGVGLIASILVYRGIPADGRPTP